MAAEIVLITGASSGIGLELARCFAEAKSDLVLVARCAEKLRDLAQDLSGRYGVRVEVLVKDLAAPDAPRELAQQLEALGLTIDVLVNNAGFGARGAVAELDPQRQIDMVRVNVGVVVELTRRLLPGMLARKRGGVLSVGSTAAFQAGPWMAVYYASKAFVLHFTEALAEEIAGTGVTATCLCPGPTATEFADQADLGSVRLFRIGMMSAGKVAQAGYHGFRRGKVIVVPGLRNKLLAFGVRLVPRLVARKIAGWLQR